VHWQPECWKRRYGKPDFASDIFSFGMMLWEILARVHIYTAFPGVADIPKPDGTTNVELVAARIANGQRPSAPPEGCPVLLFKVMQACWVRKMSARPTAPWLLDAMKALRASAGALDGPEPEPEPEPADASPSYDDWLRSLDMQKKKDELAEWDVKEDEDPLGKLAEMLREEVEEEVEDLQEMLVDLFGQDDEEAQQAFRAAVQKLSEQATEAAAAAAEEGAEEGADEAWSALVVRLGLDGGAEERIAEQARTIEAQAGIIEELERGNAELARANVELERGNAERDNVIKEQAAELRKLRALAGASEGELPQ
jgi:hypothetical protein